MKTLVFNFITGTIIGMILLTVIWFGLDIHPPIVVAMVMGVAGVIGMNFLNPPDKIN